MPGKQPSLLLFGGKGGVGKTTCSAAIAVQSASRGVRTLHLTSDKAPSLSDVYGVEIGDRITSLGHDLDAMEISQEHIADIWKSKFGPDFHEILSHILDMDGMDGNSDVDLLDYIGTAPSLREETMLDMIVEMAAAGRYDTIIWDTAPAGETLNLLDMPRAMRAHLRAGARVYEAIDRITGKIVGKRTLAEIMEEWVVRSEGIARFLKREAAFIVVANPESLVVRQASRIIASLNGFGFPIRGLIINRVAVGDGSDFLTRMTENQGPYMEQLFALANGVPVAEVPFSLDEIRGVETLRTIGIRLAGDLLLNG